MKYFEEINFNFFKKNTFNDYQYVNINYYIKKYMKENNLKVHSLQDYKFIIFNFFKDYMIGKNIKIECIKIKKPYIYKSDGNFKKGKIKEGIFKFKLKKIEFIGDGETLALYDDKYKYISGYSNCANCQILEIINRKISKLDPYGEEIWDE